jgi:hypothetical protein
MYCFLRLIRAKFLCTESYLRVVLYGMFFTVYSLRIVPSYLLLPTGLLESSDARFKEELALLMPMDLWQVSA